MPRAAARPQVAAQAPLELRGEALDLAVERDVVHLHAAVGEQALEVAVAERNCRDHLTAHRMTSAGKRKPRNTRASAMGSALECGRSAGAPLLPACRPPLNATESVR